jgi:hypothetical protein
VDSHTFLVWLVQQMTTCNLAQAGFVAHLADEYLDGMLASRALTKPFVDACLAKLTEVGGLLLAVVCFSHLFFLCRSEHLLKDSYSS